MLIRAFFYFLLAVTTLFFVGILTFLVGWYIFYRKKIKRLRAIRKSKYKTDL